MRPGPSETVPQDTIGFEPEANGKWRVPGCVQILLASGQKPTVNGGYLGASSSDRPRVRADTIGIGARRQ